ncbi:MAG TPA: hypothetical protein VHI98_04130 [Vicinamibacterales bacterium]|nr:hypothetical protein [Vicinamibacterales bacterium]
MDHFPSGEWISFRAARPFRDRGMAAWLWTPIVAAVLLLLLAWATGNLHRRMFITLPLLMVLLAGLTLLM